MCSFFQVGDLALLRVGSPNCLAERFSVPGAAIKQGRRQEPCTKPDRHRCAPIRADASLTAVLLRLAIRMGVTAEPTLGPYRHFVTGPHHLVQHAIKLPRSPSQSTVRPLSRFRFRALSKSSSLADSPPTGYRCEIRIKRISPA